MIQYSLRSLILVCLLSAIQCSVPWSTLTEAELSELPSNEFEQILALQLGSIPPQAFRGFNASQISLIPATSMRGMNALQINNLTRESCSGFNGPQFSEILPASISGFTPHCITSIHGTAFVNISAEQFSEFSMQTCRAFWFGFIRNVPSLAFNGLTPECASQFTLNALFPVTANQLHQIRVEVFSAFSATQILYLPGAAFSRITAEQLAAIEPLSCGGLNSAHVSQMPAEVALGLTPECASNFGNSASSGMSRQFLANIPVRTFATFTALQIGRILPQTLNNIRLDQLLALPPEACSGLGTFQMAAFPPSLARGITARCLYHFSREACRGLTSAFIEAMDPAAAIGLAAHCLDEIGESESCGGLTAQFIANIPPEAVEGFSSSCIRETKSDAFRLISPRQLQRISVPAFNGFIDSIQHISHDVLQAASLNQLANLSRGLGGMTAEQMTLIVGKFRLDIVNLWTAEQIQGVDIVGFKKNVPDQVPLVSHWHDRDVSAITWLQLALLKTIPAPDFHEDAISRMPGYAAAGFRADQIRTLTLAAVSTFTSVHSQHFVRDVTASFSAEQLASLRDTSFGSMSLDGIVGIRHDIIPYITESQLLRLTTDQLSIMSCDQVNSFTKNQLSTLNSKQREVIDKKQGGICGVNPPLTNVIPPRTDTDSAPSEDDEGNGSKIVLILMSSMVGFAAVIGVAVFVIQRRRAVRGSSNEEPLLEQY